MINEAQFVDWILVPNEVEALILEDSLIKQHHPNYNIRFRDDKRYPMLRLDITDPFPTLTVVRKSAKDGSLYYGPYTSSRTMRSILHIIQRYFPLRRCQGNLQNKSSRACLNYQMNRCPGICINQISRDVYQKTVDQVRLLLSGKTHELIAQLLPMMEQFSLNLNFEAAAQIRDQIASLKYISGGRKLILPNAIDLDVFACSIYNEIPIAEVLYVRGGIITGNSYVTIENTELFNRSEIAQKVLLYHYEKGSPIPSEILIDIEPESSSIVEMFLSQKRDQKVTISVPKKGIKNALIRMATANLENRRRTMELHSVKHESDVLHSLMVALKLPVYPARIEAIDISENQGKYPVGCIVTFLKGEPDKSNYRRFKLANAKAQSDPERIKEVLRRRIGHRSFWGLPDLLLIDGGYHQLRAAKEILDEQELDIPLISIAKIRNNRSIEGIFLKSGIEINLDTDSKELLVLDRIRDEAHRFAITYHRELKEKAQIQSTLLDIPRLNKETRGKLLQKFGSIENIRNATLKDLISISGVGVITAKKILNHLKNSHAEK